MFFPRFPEGETCSHLRCVCRRIDASHCLAQEGSHTHSMNSQTARKPESKRPARSNKAKKYVKQTARFEGRRDGQPLIFGWGGHLSHKEKIRFQQRATWAAAALIA